LTSENKLQPVISPTALGDYEIIKQRAGFHSVRHIPSGEIMHSVNEPVSEAVSLYVNQAGLGTQLAAARESGLVLWDAGMGAGTNAMSAIIECEKLYAQKSYSRGIRIISFENDLDPLRLAVMNKEIFPHVNHQAPEKILAHGIWRSSHFPIEWVLLEGDFSVKLGTAPAPDIIFYDLFSTITNASMWRLNHFRKIFTRCAGRSSVLITYTVSTAARAALLAAGFYVGYGAAAGPKSRTTIALSSPDSRIYEIELLDREWLGRFSRSTARYSADSGEDEQMEIVSLVNAHPQFR
jgi:queuine tRNA-ribosyltransferase